MNIVLQITEKDMQKGTWVLDEVGRLAGLLSGTAKPDEPNPMSWDVQENPKPAAPEPPSVPAVGIEEVRAAVAKVSRKHGSERAKAILRKFGAENLSALAAEHYEAAMKEAEEAL